MPEVVKLGVLEPSVTQNGWAGFDAFAVTDPYIFRFEDTYYMFYTGWGALDEPEAHRPDDGKSLAILGPCMRPGMDRRLYNDVKNLPDTANKDNTPGVVIAPRIGVATSLDGIHWDKKKAPIIGIGSTCSAYNGMLELLKLFGVDLGFVDLASGGDFDYFGALAPRVRSDTAADGEPVFSILYTGLHVRRLFDFTSLGGLDAMKLDLTTGRELYGGMKTSVGLARSFDVTEGWTKLETSNPVFNNGSMYSPIWEQYPTVIGLEDSYFAYYGEINSEYLGTPYDYDNVSYIALATRKGTVYALCTAVKNSAKTAPAQAAMVLLLMLLPACAIYLRKMWR
jgi:hypothetical protein